MIIIVEGLYSKQREQFAHDIRDYYWGLMEAEVFQDTVNYIHSHDMPVMTEKMDTVMNLIEAGIVTHAILDGFHVSEFVYDGLNRARKNAAMWSIDERLAKVAGSDVKDWEAEEPDEDIVDPGMSYQSRVHNPVVLVYVVPPDVKAESEKQGTNLERYYRWYDDFYDNTMIPNKIKVDYDTLDLAIEYIDELLGIKGLEWPEIPPEPTKPPSGGDISLDVGQTFILDFEEDDLQVTAVVTDGEIELTATADDIRVGKVAVGADGLTTGELEVPEEPEEGTEKEPETDETEDNEDGN